MLRAALALLAVIAASSPALAQRAANPTRAQVRQLLSGVEDVPTLDEWRTVGDAALPHLIALYDTPSEAPYVRLRAIDAVAAFPGVGVRRFLLAVAELEGQSDLYVRAAVRALGRAFGDGALPELQRFLQHSVPTVREMAARELGRLELAPARRALRQRMARETNAEVRRAIDAALTGR